jgi:hypothetical protein
MVRTIRKDDDTQFVNWDLNNERRARRERNLSAYIELRDRWENRHQDAETYDRPEVAQHVSE